MKRILYILISAITLGSLFSCEPVEDRDSLPAITLTPETLKFSVVQNPSKNNEVKLTNLDSSVIPYWSCSDSNGELAHYNTDEQTVFFPFAGNYTVNFTAFTRGGAVYAKPVNVKVDHNDSSYFSDPKWNLLTNGTAGKTWIINFVTESPFAFVPAEYVNTTVGGGSWSWFPGSVNDVSWSGIEVKDWGEVTFDLNGGYNVSVTQTSLTTGSHEQTTTKGTYTFQRTDDFTNDRLMLNGGIQMLHTNAYYNETMSGFSFSDVRLLELTATSLRYAIIRNDGVQVVMNLVPKTAN
ncbi:hypothetical protein [Flavobacterium aestuarii]|uniref:hypothetical protein n=1 Tax=Flavobacterium aestuarii TaxID=3149227 RepID=UPI0032B374F3